MIQFTAGLLAGWALGGFYWVYVVPTLTRRRIQRNSSSWQCDRCGFIIVAHRSAGVTAQVLADVDELVAEHRAGCG